MSQTPTTPPTKPIKNAGKGSGRRIEKFKEIQKNWSDIKGFRPSKFK